MNSKIIKLIYVFPKQKKNVSGKKKNGKKIQATQKTNHHALQTNEKTYPRSATRPNERTSSGRDPILDKSYSIKIIFLFFFKIYLNVQFYKKKKNGASKKKSKKITRQIKI
jgi:hypothetical protein